VPVLVLARLTPFITGARVCLAASGLLGTAVFAQGPLTPPGAPAPTYRTFAQVEPRFPVSHYGTNLATPGSYYLTTNLASSVINTDGIRMNGPNEYRDNMTSGCDTNYLAGTDRGNNC
jgi:hypothetical protein